EAELIEIALRLLTNENERRAVAERATKIAKAKLSFRAGRETLARFFATLKLPTSSSGSHTQAWEPIPFRNFVSVRSRVVRALFRHLGRGKDETENTECRTIFY